MSRPFRDDTPAIEAALEEKARRLALDAEAGRRSAGEVARFDARKRQINQAKKNFGCALVGVLAFGLIAAVWVAVYVFLQIAGEAVPKHG
jgi:hypothetical protein